MERKLGKTGLTQKEAVFGIIKSVLGSRYNPHVSVEQMFTRKGPTDVRPTCNMREIRPMIDIVAKGLSDGTIPSKHNSASSQKQIDQYANRIVHYWLSHDRRLNGNQSGTRKNLAKKRSIVIAHRLEEDPILKGLRIFQHQTETLEDELQIELYVLGQSFWIILETYGIDPREIPEHVQKALRMNHGDFVPQEKKKVA
jgi:hypothetical protein